MPGNRPLTESECHRVLAELKVPAHRLLFLMGIRTGLRISQLLALRVMDVGDMDVIQVIGHRGNNKARARDIPLTPQTKETIAAYLVGRERDGSPLFPNINYEQARYLLTMAYKRAGLSGHLVTHCMRKAYAMKVYERTGHDLLATQRALGHTAVSTTERYLTVDMAKLATIIGSD